MHHDKPHRPCWVILEQGLRGRLLRSDVLHDEPLLAWVSEWSNARPATQQVKEGLG